MTTKNINSVQFLETFKVSHYWLDDGIVSGEFVSLWIGENICRAEDELDYLAVSNSEDGTIAILIHCDDGGSEVYSGIDPKTVKINDRNWWQKLLLD